jgi:hypothetical protein
MMAHSIRILSVLNGAVWLALFGQNIFRYFNGWGRDALGFGIGLIPMIGIVVALLTYRSKSRMALAIAILMTIAAAVYVFGAETGVADVIT